MSGNEIVPVGNWQDLYGTAITSDHEFYGRRMQLLTQASGSGRFLNAAPDTLVGLAQSNTSDQEMLDIFLTAGGQVALNEMKDRFESIPRQFQKAEFGLLPDEAQNVLLQQGYAVPEDEEKKSLLQRMFTWDNPLLPEEYIPGIAKHAVKAFIAPVGFALGKTASGLWHYINSGERYVARLWRSVNFSRQRRQEEGRFWDPGSWREGWNESKLDKDSYDYNALKKAKELIGDEETARLRRFLSGGGEAVVQDLLDQGMSMQEAQTAYWAWYDRLSEPAFAEAEKTLQGSRNTFSNAMVDSWNNHSTLPDVDPDAWTGKVVGGGSAFVATVFMDPINFIAAPIKWVNKAVKGAVTGGNFIEQLSFWRRVSSALDGVDAAALGGRKIGLNEAVDDAGRNFLPTERIQNWAASTGQRWYASTNLNIIAHGRAMNRMRDRIVDAFKIENEIMDAAKNIRHQRNVNGLEPLPDRELAAAVLAETGQESVLNQLSRDFPKLDPILDSMMSWHIRNRQLSEAGKEVTRVQQHIGDLSTNTGYWNFWSRKEGLFALSSRSGGVNPDAMMLPRISVFGEQWVKGKRFMRETFDLDNPGGIFRTEMAEMVAEFLSKQKEFAASAIAKGIDDGHIVLGSPNKPPVTLTANQVDELLDDILAGGDTLTQKLSDFGLTQADRKTIEDAYRKFEGTAFEQLRANGELSDLGNYYLAQGYTLGSDGLTFGKYLEGSAILRGPRAARKQFLETRMHPVGGANDELQGLMAAGVWLGANAVALAYYPAVLARKLTTYTPKNEFLDVLNMDTAISEFKALIDMGSMANVPRSSIDHYLRLFITGNEAQRWMVQTEFMMDFLGRSGALIHGGPDIENFIQRFIRHGQARYSTLSNDYLGLYGMNMRRAVYPSAHQAGHFSSLNVIPNYRAMASVSRYMAFYRMAGQGLHLPFVDKLFAKWWRPAVLLRLGYVPRNGGEELFSWMLREGPRAYTNQLLARRAVNLHVRFDEYGRKVIKTAEDLGKDVHHAFVWKPVSRIWRSFNEIIGVGDKAIMTRGLRNAVNKNPVEWQFLSEPQKALLFEDEMVLAREWADGSLRGISRGLFTMAESASNRVGLFLHGVAEMGHIKTKGEIANAILKRTDKDHLLRKQVILQAMTQPTYLDAQMKNVLGAFDAYLDFEQSSVHQLLRSAESSGGVRGLTSLPMDYSRRELKFVTATKANIASDELTVAMAQNLQKMAEDPYVAAAVSEMMQYVPEHWLPELEQLAARLIARLPASKRARFEGGTVYPGDEVMGAETARTSSGTKVEIEGATAEYWPQEDLGLTYDQVDEIISGQTPVDSGDLLAPTSGWELSRLSPKNKPLSRVVGDEGLSYHYTGSTYQAEAWPEEIRALKEQIEELTGYEFDLAIIQKYPDGSTDLGWHWDTEYVKDGVRVTEPGRGVQGRPEGVIVSVNFGATRKFEFRPRNKPSGIKYGYKEERHAAGSVDLGDGDVLLMSGGTQGNLEHRIVREAGQVGPRINITFRQVGKSHRSPRKFGNPSETLDMSSDVRATINSEGHTVVKYTDGENTILSNYAEIPFVFKGYRFLTAEGAYHAFKSGTYVEGFNQLGGAAARALGRKLGIAVNKHTNEALMERILIAKFEQSDDFRAALMSTSSSIVHPVGDPFWKQAFPRALSRVKSLADGRMARTVTVSEEKLTLQLVRSNPDKIYLFEDTLTDVAPGVGQAAVRGEPNVIGIPTKWDSGDRMAPTRKEESSFFAEDNESARMVIDDAFESIPIGAEVVIPPEGIGGVGRLSELNPDLQDYINERIATLKSSGIRGSGAWMDNPSTSAPAGYQGVQIIGRSSEKGFGKTIGEAGVRSTVGVRDASAGLERAIEKSDAVIVFTETGGAKAPGLHSGGMDREGYWDDMGEFIETPDLVSGSEARSSEVLKAIREARSSDTPLLVVNPLLDDIGPLETEIASFLRENRVEKLFIVGDPPSQSIGLGASVSNNEGSGILDRALAKVQQTQQHPTPKKPAPSTHSVTKIISGGQTGADRTGLEVGKSLGFETGGVAPAGFKTNMGADPDLGEVFGLTESGSSGYSARTKKNVDDADGTVIIDTTSKVESPNKTESAGSKLTEDHATKTGKPFIVNPTDEEFVAWLAENNISVLNVAGNRKWDGRNGSRSVVNRTRKLLTAALKTEKATPVATTVAEPKGAAETVLTILREQYGEVRSRLTRAMDNKEELAVAFDEATEKLSPNAKAFLEDIFIGNATERRDYNFISFLLGGADSSRLTSNYDEIVERARLAMSNKLMTPEGQHAAQAMARANVGLDGNPGGNPLPPGMVRTFYPMVPVEFHDELVRLFSVVGDTSADRFKTEFVRILNANLEAVGHPPIAEKVLHLMHPANTGGTATSLSAIASSWIAMKETHFPLTIGSTDDRVAHAIARTFDQLEGFSGSSRQKGRIASWDTASQEFANDPTLGELERTALGGPDVDITRNGIREVNLNDDRMSAPMPSTLHTFYGMDDRGILPSIDFGGGGVSNQLVFGVAPRRFVANPGAPRPVTMADGAPAVHKINIYENRVTGERTIVPAGDERKTSWFHDQEWKLVESHNVPNGSLRTFADLASMNGVEEATNMLTSASRNPGQMEPFQPWLREVDQARRNERPVDAGRIGHHAGNANWWENAPDKILGYTPAIPQNRGLEGARQTVLSHWFDGVVNPMIGAMVREPMFHHYLVIAYKQTQDMRLFFHHRPGHYKALEESGFGRYLSVDEDLQIVFDDFEDFIKFDWPLAHNMPDTPINAFALAMESQDPRQIQKAAKELFPTMKAESPSSPEDPLRSLIVHLMSTDDVDSVHKFSLWASNRKRMHEQHRDVAIRRAMTLTSAFIDDHRIRSQFQEMVGTLIPFWFAEDQFLRRMGRSMAHNPLMLRDLNLVMQAGVNSGMIREDQHGEQRLVYPGSEMFTTAVLAATKHTPFLKTFFGGDLGSIGNTQLTSSINVIPGYDVDTVGQMGMGPLLAIPLLFASQRDPSIRTTFERNLTGGRYGTRRSFDSTAATEIVWGSIAPAIITRSIATMWSGGDSAARAKASMDVIVYRMMNDQLPSEEFLALQPNKELYLEELMDKIDEEAKQLQMLQAMTWFVGPASFNLSELTLKNEAWEWNQEFYELVQTGLPFEEAYRMWQNRIIAQEGEFDPFIYSPFRASRSTKVPFAVLETTQTANTWLADNSQFVSDYRYASGFFMPRGFEDDDNEYSAEARARQLAYGLRVQDTPEEFLNELYFNNAYSQYARERQNYLSIRYEMKAKGANTLTLDREWQSWNSSFEATHPVYASHLSSGGAGGRREDTIQEFRLILQDTSGIEDAGYKEDVLTMMATIVGLDDELKGLVDPRRSQDLTDARNDTKIRYYSLLTEFASGKPWLNELYYSVFMPLLGDTWMAKYNAGLIGNLSTARV